MEKGLLRRVRGAQGYGGFFAEMYRRFQLLGRETGQLNLLLYWVH
jgi:hypothetical protein